MRHHSYPLGWQPKKIKISADMDMEKLETLMHCWWEGRMVPPLQNTLRQFLKKLETELSYDPVRPLLGIFQKKTESRDTYVSV